MQVAIADDEEEMRCELMNALEEANHRCDCFTDGQELIEGLQRNSYDVVLLDWNMPRANGLDVLEWSKSFLENPPAFVLISSRSDETAVIAALEQGASDYLVKPQTGKMIVARTEAAAKGSKSLSSNRRASFGRYTIDRASKCIAIDGKDAKLSSSEFDIAVVFFANVNRPLSRHYLLQELDHNAEFSDLHELERLISRIRFKLQIRPENGFSIQTVFGFGYRMEAT